MSGADNSQSRQRPRGSLGRAHSQPERIEQLVRSLKSLHGGEEATFALIGCGRAAVPALRQVLFEPDPSGFFEPRCWAVKALAEIGARDVLIEFLRAPRAVPSLGEEAVMDAAARALVGWDNPELYKLLIRLAEQRRLPGVIEALSAFRNPEAIPVLISALAEDSSRDAAEDGFRRLGALGRSALVQAAIYPDRSDDLENEGSLRRRGSALQLLQEVGVRTEQWRVLRILIDEEDTRLAILACKLCLSHGDSDDKSTAIKRLIAILPNTDWFLAGEIEDSLVQNFSGARELIGQALRNIARQDSGDERFSRTLQRVIARGGG